MLIQSKLTWTRNLLISLQKSLQKLLTLTGLASLFLLLSFGSFAGDTNQSKPDVQTISAEQLLKNRDDYIVLDVRTMGEFAIGHIEGAINISHHDVEDELERLRKLDKPIVVHCRSGKRAASAERVLLQNNITNIYHLEGDMLGWEEKDLPLVRGLD